jgi:S1-C subfamily serine protease
MSHRAILVALFFVATRATAAVVQPDPEKRLKSVADRVHSTVVEVRAVAAAVIPAEDKSQEIVPTASFGTGVLLGAGLVVTTLHTVGVALPGQMAAWKNIEALVPDAGAFAAEVVAWFPDAGLALLRIPANASQTAPVFATEPPQRGATLLAMGAGEDAVTAPGVVVVGVAGETLWLTSRSSGVDSRYWGGPLFDEEGRLAGITLPSVTPKALTSAALVAMLERVRGH